MRTSGATSCKRPELRRRLAATVALVATAACARVAPPPGGAEDREPPRVLEIVPAGDAYGVAADSAVTFVFSEKPDKNSVMRALTIFPPADFAETSWKEATLRLVPKEGWARNQNTILRIGETARDRRGNAMKKAFQSRFTTKIAPDSGEVSGKVWKGKEVASTSKFFVAAFAANAGDSLDPTEAYPVALNEVGTTGAYRLEWLDTQQTYHVVAFVDRDGDIKAASSDEIWARAPAPVTFAAPHGRVVQLPDFLVGTLDSIGRIQGEVTVDSGEVAIVIARKVVEADRPDENGLETSSERDVAKKVLEGGGSFSLEVLSGARYSLSAFLDVDRDSLPEPEEPFVELEDPISLEFTSRASGVRFDLRGMAPISPDSVATSGETMDETTEEASENEP